ncbi:MAG: 3'-5' exonuclease [Bacilli bacterium]|jgi:DNA helicase-2/ATP-dependent DNA helicase PcrA|nr:3'-5' exonuclease [Bacilli bacterium]MDD3348405.1 3'-5' exonuclease [Bacilli bacterium]MDD4056428.1 3'-5' exonuclease [Bacilli bacterium]MDY0208664.1 3'-5' exonuclease [Bacilli bacterium]
MEKLNEMQLAAVKNTEGYLRVIAGAGSGKTKMLVNRYAYLTNEIGISSKNILCVTFSNKAANEMKSRIKKLLDENVDVSFVTTYHALGAKIIGENSERIFYPRNFQIIDQIDQKQILSEIYEELELKLDSGSFEKILDRIGAFKDNMHYIIDMITPKKPIEMNTIKLDDMIIRKYLEYQKRRYLLDFDDLIHFAIYILQHNEDIRQKWQDRLNYIQVDEFQDSTVKELMLLDLISGKYKNVMIVGDPDQNIYEWRGSQMELLIDYDKKHIPTTTIVLNQNYRSSSKILKCANTLIEKNKNRYPKELFTVMEGGEDVLYYHAKTDHMEADWITARVKFLRDIHNVSYSDIAILYRASYSSRIIENKLLEAAIPYEIIGNIKFFHRMEIKDIIAYMRLVAFDDDSSFKRVINVPKRKMGKIKRFKLYAMQELDQSLFTTLKENLHLFSKGNDEIVQFVDVIDYLQKNKNSMDALTIFDELMAKTGYDTYIRELGNMERFENLLEFKKVIQELLIDSKDLGNLEEFLNYLAIQSDREMETLDKVKLMTVHAAKGLEFDNVFVISLNDGIFPSNRTIEERQIAGLEEERRLCYVALTRAKKRLFLSNSESYSHEGAIKIPSRFLIEIGEENYLSIGVKNKPIEETTPTYDLKYQIGAQVEHPVFGIGEIIRIDYQNKTYQIKFKQYEYPRAISIFYDFEKQLLDEAVPTKENRQEPAPTEPEEFIPEVIEETMVDDDNFDHEENQSYLIKIDDEGNFTEGFSEEASMYGIENQSSGLWKDPNVPKTGWTCVGITDLGKPSKLCHMCENATIRYAHHMRHPNYPHTLTVGCICAGKMEGNDLEASKREKELKNYVARRKKFLNREWKKTAKGFPKYTYKGVQFIIFPLTKNKEFLLYINGKKQEQLFKTQEECAMYIFQRVEDIRKIAQEK